MVLGPGPLLQAVPCLCWPRTEAGVSRLAHSLVSSLPSLGRARVGDDPTARAHSTRSNLQEAALRLAGVLIWCVAVRVSTLRSGSRLVFLV